MAAISSIQEKSDAVLTGQVEKTARPAPERDRQIKILDPSQLDQLRDIRPQKQPAEPTPTPSEHPSYEETVAVAEKLQSRILELAAAPHSVSIRTDEDTNHYVIEIQDPEGKVVKQFPSEKVLNLHQKLDDLSGMVIDEMI